MKRHLILGIMMGCMLSGCASREAELAQHRDAIASAIATATTIGDAWLGGRVSSTYARVACERTLRLVEDDRQSLAASLELLSDPHGAALSDEAEELARALAQMRQAITTGDSARVRMFVSKNRRSAAAQR
jgi:hypothetical protein